MTGHGRRRSSRSTAVAELRCEPICGKRRPGARFTAGRRGPPLTFGRSGFRTESTTHSGNAGAEPADDETPAHRRGMHATVNAPDMGPSLRPRRRPEARSANQSRSRVTLRHMIEVEQTCDSVSKSRNPLTAASFWYRATSSRSAPLPSRRSVALVRDARSC